MKDRQAVLVRRDTGAKRTVKLTGIVAEVTKELDAVQENLFRRASDALAENTREAGTLDELKGTLAQKGGIVRIRWCGDAACELKMKEETGGKILNVPLDQKSTRGKCVVCGRDGPSLVNFGKSY